MRQSESTFQEFWRTTYRSGSPVPYVISAQVVVFVLIHLFDLLVELEATPYSLYDIAVDKLTLPANLSRFMSQPWSLLTYPFLYTNLLRLFFDCLWLYWMGTIFLNLLSGRQFLTLFGSTIVLGSMVYIGVSQLPFPSTGPSSALSTSAVGLAAIATALINLVPRTQIRLLLLGTVPFRTIAIIYLVVQLAFYVNNDLSAAVTYIAAAAWGWIFMANLKNGRDFSTFFKKRQKRELRVVRTHGQSHVPIYRSYKADLPNQEEIDAILDKISLSGYDSLTAEEKEALFRVSDQKKK